MSYTDFAYIYDRLIGQDYDQWADYLETVFEKYRGSVKTVLDLACGTGSITTLLARRGYDMIGIDKSCDMLAIAEQKRNNLPIRYVCQDMAGFRLHGAVDAVICTLDSVNYITDTKKLKNMFSLVKKHLNPNGLFVFDISSEYKISEILGNNTYVDDCGEIFYVWENFYNPKSKICTYRLTFFIKNGAKYDRKDEFQKQRAYSQRQMENMLAQADLSVMNCFDGLTFNRPCEKSERLLFVCKNIC